MFHVKRQDLPALDLGDFSRGLLRACRAVSGGATPELPPETRRALHAHYTELRRWSRGLALIGSGTTHDVLGRHYAESLVALPLLPPPIRPPGLQTAPPVLLDLGSGAGFPGWVLATARPDMTSFLVEARERKWAFLQAATRRALAPVDGGKNRVRRSTGGSRGVQPSTSLPIECLNARVGIPLPEALPLTIDVVTVRALKLEPEVLAALARRMSRKGRFLLWLGAETPRLPPQLLSRRELPIGGSRQRRVLELVPAAS